MQTTLKAVLDKKGSETLPNNHFSFTSLDNTIKGGVYIDKSIKDVKEIVIILGKEGD